MPSLRRSGLAPTRRTATAHRMPILRRLSPLRAEPRPGHAALSPPTSHRAPAEEPDTTMWTTQIRGLHAGCGILGIPQCPACPDSIAQERQRAGLLVCKQHPNRCMVRATFKPFRAKSADWAKYCAPSRRPRRTPCQRAVLACALKASAGLQPASSAHHNAAAAPCAFAATPWCTSSSKRLAWASRSASIRNNSRACRRRCRPPCINEQTWP